MAVIVQYVVVREGSSEQMVFTSKKEADAYDRLLDIADRMFLFLAEAGVELDEERREALALFLAENRARAITLLRGGKLAEVSGKAKAAPGAGAGRGEKNAPKKVASGKGRKGANGKSRPPAPSPAAVSGK